LLVPLSIKRANAIITDSDYTKSELIRLFPFTESKTQTIHLGVDKKFRSIEEKDLLIGVKKKYSLPDDFILYVGTIEPRKNLASLFIAYSVLLKENKDIPPLVVAGGTGWKTESIFNTLEELKIKDRVIFTGYVEADELPVLYNLCLVFVYPSLYEGFGLPHLRQWHALHL
jgi:glycosyltransferase involved in cell wall biosynthesis